MKQRKPVFSAIKGGGNPSKIELSSSSLLD
jgi:hypothetical protein